jgi:hypothetical protein
MGCIFLAGVKAIEYVSLCCCTTRFSELKRCWLAAYVSVFDCIIHCAVTGYNLNYRKIPSVNTSVHRRLTALIGHFLLVSTTVTLVVKW